MLDKLCRDIWMRKDITKASFILEAHANELSDSNYTLLCEVIFGTDPFKFEYTKIKRDGLETFSAFLTKWFDKIDFYQPKYAIPKKNIVLDFLNFHTTPWEGLD